jgi:microsomal dipeptidase-like Zn-dependent dipeptidase
MFELSLSAQSPGTWGPLEAGHCVEGADGVRYMTAVFRDKPDGLSWDEACRQDKNVLGRIAQPDACRVNWKFGFIPWGRRGFWQAPDTACLSSPPAPPHPGGDGTLQSTLPFEGFADLHVHQMADLGFGGSIVHGGAFGDPATALGPIPERFRPGHETVEAAVNGRILQVLVPKKEKWHAESGHPQFTTWPSNHIWTHQQVYQDWLFRAYQGGLRLMVMLAANSEDMFGRGENRLPLLGGRQFQKYKAAGRSGNDMESLEWQVRAAYEMEKAIDLAAGGKGLGWYRIVRDPEEAGTAISQGKLAVILGTELQHLFNCDLDRPDCDAEVIRDGLNRLEGMGVNYVFPIHHKANQFGGPAMFQVLNTGPDRSCPDVATKCSELGLSALGKELVHELTRRGMLIDTEHLSRLSFSDVMNIAETGERYPVLAGHVVPLDLQTAKAGATERAKTSQEIRRVLDVGGIVAPILSVGSGQYAKPAAQGVPFRCDDPNTSNGSAEQWANAYLLLRDLAKDAGSAIGSIAFGSDWNGFAGWPSPRFESERRCAARKTPGGAIEMEGKVTYPFGLPPLLLPASAGPTTQLDLFDWPSGTRVWNYNTVGAAHIGMMPDFIQNLRMLGLTMADLEPIYRSARGVVDLWKTARKREVGGDLHHLRWVPQSPFDILPFTYWDPSRDVNTAHGFAICRTRTGHRLGFLIDNRCELVESASVTPAVTAGSIVAYHAGRCFDVGSRRRGSHAVQQKCSTADTQVWEFRTLGVGVYEIVNRGTGFCLSVPNGRSSPGAPVTQETCTSDQSQHWKIERSGNTFRLAAASSSLCLELKDESRKYDEPVRQAECSGAAHQQWSIDALRAGDYERLYQADKGHGAGPRPQPIRFPYRSRSMTRE